MARGFSKYKNNTAPASEVVRQALVAAGWVRLNDRAAYECPPGLTWPLPSYPLESRLLGVPGQRLREVGIPEDQAGLAELFLDPVRKLNVLETLRDNLAYRLGGCWHYAESPHAGISGANVQRLEEWAFLAAAAQPWTTLRSHLITGAPLVIDITNSDRQKVTPTGRAGTPTVAQCWDQLAASPIHHWTTGFGFGDRCDVPGLNGSVMVQVMARPGGSRRKIPGHQIILTPLGVALAAGFRGRLNRQAKSEIHHDESAQELMKFVWQMREPARRLLLHVLSAATPTNPAHGLSSYLEDSWLLAALLGAKTGKMTEGNRNDLRDRRAQAAEEVAEAVGSTRIERFVRDSVLPLRKTKVAAPPVHQGRGPNQPRAPRVGAKETTPPTAGSAAQASRQDMGEPTPRPGGDDAKTSRFGWIHLVAGRLGQAFRRLLAFSRKEELNRNIRTLPPPDAQPQTIETVTGLPSGHDRPVPQGGLNTVKDEKRLRESDTPGDPDKTMGPGDQDTSSNTGGTDHEGKDNPLGTEPSSGQPSGRPSQMLTGFQPRQGVDYVPPGSAKPSSERYALPLGSERDIPQEELSELNRFLQGHPQVEETHPRDTLLRLLAYQPANDDCPISARQLIPILISAPPNRVEGYLEALMRMIDTAPDDLIQGKPQHLAFAIESDLVLRIWLGWQKHAVALLGWPAFAGLDPYRVAAGMSWQKKAPVAVRTIEAAAKAFADWWVITKVDPVMGRIFDPALEVQALGRLIEAMKAAYTPYDLAMAMSALADPAGFLAHGCRVEGCWRRLHIAPSEILPAPDRLIDRIGHPINASKEEAC